MKNKTYIHIDHDYTKEWIASGFYKIEVTGVVERCEDEMYEVHYGVYTGVRGYRAHQLIDITDPEDADLCRYFKKAGFDVTGPFGGFQELVEIENDDDIHYIIKRVPYDDFMRLVDR